MLLFGRGAPPTAAANSSVGRSGRAIALLNSRPPVQQPEQRGASPFARRLADSSRTINKLPLLLLQTKANRSEESSSQQLPNSLLLLLVARALAPLESVDRYANTRNAKLDLVESSQAAAEATKAVGARERRVAVAARERRKQ